MSVKIILDSTSDVAEHLRDQFTVVPLTLRFDEEEFIDGVTIDRQKFYEKLIESDVLPKTSQANPNDFHKAFQSIVEQGDEAVVLTVSRQLSGTYQSAVIAAEDFPEKITVVDSGTVAIGIGILAELALKWVHEGRSAHEIAEKLIEERNKVIIIATLDTLEYLKKGGRISGAAAFAGGLLSIKPVLSVKDGSIHMLGKARGSKQGNNLLVKQIQDCGGIDFSKPVLLGYTGITDVFLKKYVEDSRHLWEGNLEELHKTQIGSIIGTHAGPGAVAAAFFQKK